jgi:cephalosporin-C deacetylase
MPQYDMPLDELRAYAGTNPKPDDFDAFWEAGLAETRAVDARIELVPVDLGWPRAACFDLTFTGVGGARIYAKYVRPIDGGPHMAAVKFHGYTMDSGAWAELLPLVSQGVAVAAMDCRGQGGRSEDVGGVVGNTHHGHIIRGLFDAPEKLLFRSIYLDAAQLAGIVADFDEVDADRLGAFGGSQGGALAIACAALEPRIKRAVAVYPFLCDFQRVWQMDATVRHAYRELTEFFKKFDPTHKRQAEWFRRLGYIDVQHLASRVRADVLFATGLMDDVCPPSSQFAAYNKLGGPKEMALYPDFGHENLPGMADRTITHLLGL